jgi:hypothetical protein
MDIIYKIMISCVIMHNIIIKNDHNNLEPLFDLANVSLLQCVLTFQTDMESIEELDNSHTHYNLRTNLVKHL